MTLPNKIINYFTLFILILSCSSSKNNATNLVVSNHWFIAGPAIENESDINTEDPAVKAKLTIFSDVGHNSWTRTYGNTAIDEGNVNYDRFDTTIYE